MLHRISSAACFGLRLFAARNCRSIHLQTPYLHLQKRNLCSTKTQEVNMEEPSNPVSQADIERAKGETSNYEFQAETRKLLDIVAQSLYSDRQVFIRELVSNCSDALEKLKYLQLSEAGLKSESTSPEIHFKTDESKNTLTISDNGIGMTKEEMISNLGTIAKSGSKEFLQEMSQNSETNLKSLIGQFGVGFYASFMVANKIDVYSLSQRPSSQPAKWSSDGLGSFEVSNAENVQHGTKIVLHLKDSAKEFSKEETVKELVKKFSGFISAPIFVNGERINPKEPLWLQEPSQVSLEDHEDFFGLITGGSGKPRYTLFYKTDAPINMRTLLYVPDTKPALWELSRESETGVALYCRRVMILSKAQALLPRWLRFMKGVVDSEDVPLNLSRELLQDNRLVMKLNNIITSRIIRFFTEQSRKDPEKYGQFYKDYGLYFKEGIATTHEQVEKEKIASLLRFETSAMEPNKTCSLNEYIERMPPGTRNILFLSAPSRELAESSPYMEVVRDQNREVLFLYEPYDELVLMQLGRYADKVLESVENELARSDDSKSRSSTASSDASVDDKNVSSVELAPEMIDNLTSFMTTVLSGRVKFVRPTSKLISHPCIISIKEMGAVRHLLRTAMNDRPMEERLRLMDPVLEINPKHSLIKKLVRMKDTHPDLAKLFVFQLYDNSLTTAGILDDPRKNMIQLNELLTKAAEHIA